ncbi:MAG: clostripain-related cysteine peptidase [Reichenbachiella sp.]|uniref:clostripain-related cysteine peptidase n=1 Tax=Reichenbachiella sp. TaxID=2184521 RepID=UPI002965F19D|nr:clostripain-related cysteine peptidase [Reichenbachiella sp.]MDW3210643.1 clostripain-related cysteine peptidase [Reichenbachiella sp.]
MEFDESDLDLPAKNKNTTAFFKLEMDQSLRKNRLKVVAENNKFDISHPDHVKSYFKKEVLNKNYAKKYLLFTWDHGDGFGIFESIGKVPGYDGDQSTKQILSMKELRQAIEGALGGVKVDLLVMMNCYMQNIDTAYSLRNCVEYLVAPQTELGFDEYRYGEFFSVLANHPEMDAKLLSRIIIEKFHRTKDEIDDDVSISVCHLSMVESISGLLELLADELEKRIELEGTDLLNTIFEEAQSVHESKGFIDFFSLLNQIYQFGNENERSILDELIPKFYGMIIDSFVKLDDAVHCKYKSHYGMSTYTPFSVKLTWDPLFFFKKKRMDRFMNSTEFALENRWGQLMNKIEQSPN